MKLYGYESSELNMAEPASDEVSDVVPLELSEVTLCASPSELRQLAEFLGMCAVEMERMGGAYDHLHLSDQIKSFTGVPQFVVARPLP